MLAALVPGVLRAAAVRSRGERERRPGRTTLPTPAALPSALKKQENINYKLVRPKTNLTLVRKNGHGMAVQILKVPETELQNVDLSSVTTT